MKKATKRTLVIAIVLVMLCTMTVTAFAGTESKSGTFLNRYNGGTYTANLTVDSSSTKASLDVTVTQGTFPLGTAYLSGTVYGTKNGMVYIIASPYADGDFSCSCSASYTGYTNVNGTCTYYFTGGTLCTLNA